MLEHGRAIEHRDTLRTGWRRGRKAPDRHSRQEKLPHSLTPFSLGAGAGEIPATKIGRATSELQSLMRISYAVFCLKKKKNKKTAISHSSIIPHHHQSQLH